MKFNSTSPGKTANRLCHPQRLALTERIQAVGRGLKLESAAGHSSALRPHSLDPERLGLRREAQRHAAFARVGRHFGLEDFCVLESIVAAAALPPHSKTSRNFCVAPANRDEWLQIGRAPSRYRRSEFETVAKATH